MCTSFRFELEEDAAWRAHLSARGFAVVAGAMTKSEVASATALLWRDIDRVWPPEARADAVKAGGSGARWSSIRLPAHGLTPRLAQSAGAWKVRGAHGVCQAFSKVWDCDTEDLITSMDCVAIWRPWGPGSSAKRPRTEGLHLDQNPFSKPGLETVQGMVPLKRVDARVGGLAVVPGSNSRTEMEKLKTRLPNLEAAGDWCPLPRNDPGCRGAILVEAEPGDLILWDSRTVHGGMVGRGLSTESDGGAAEGADSKTPPHQQREQEEQQQWYSDVVRLSVTVCMVRRDRASEDALCVRREGFLSGRCFNHTPHETGTSTGTIHAPRDPTYVPPELTPEMELLLDGRQQSDD